MPRPSFLSLPVPNPFAVEGGEEAPVHVVEAPGRFFVAFYVVGKGQGQEGAVFKAVEAAKSLYVLAEGERLFLMVGGKLGGFV